MYKTKVYFKAVPNPMEKGYISYQFDHPIHRKKILGCFRKDTVTSQKAAMGTFALNCGQTTAQFEFIEGDKP